MTPTETVKLAAYVHACCPHQALDEFTADVWHDLLGDLDLNECRQAVITIARKQPFVAASDIRAEVSRTRAKAIDAARREELLEPLRRRQLHDPRPVREQIDAIFARHGRKELLPAAPAPAAIADKPRHQRVRAADEGGVRAFSGVPGEESAVAYACCAHRNGTRHPDPCEDERWREYDYPRPEGVNP
jgi:hypothetical protein